MPSSLHEHLIDEIVEVHGATREGFRRAVHGLYDEYLADDDENTEIPGLLEQFNFRPDAWKIDDELNAVVCWEVNVSHRPMHRTARYVRAFWALDELGWTLHLINVGPEGECAAVDLLQAWISRQRAAGRKTA